MNNFTCQNIQYLPAHQCELDEDGNIVPKQGYEFNEISSREKTEFTQNVKTEDGNNIYHQSVILVNIITDINLLSDLNNSHLILKIQNLSGEYFTWGSLKPYNPVQVSITTINKTVKLTFFRNSPQPEYT